MNKWTSRKIKLSEKYTKSEREAIAYDLVTYIQKRTLRGKGKGNKSWTPPANKYSKDYKKSLDFKFKRDKSKVNLELSGDMLSSIDLLKNRKGEIIIGISESDPDHGKAEGNIRGSYGQPTGKRSKARDFLGIDPGEIKKILAKYPTKQKEKIKERVAQLEAAQQAAKKIIVGTKVKDELTIGEIALGKDN
jgi:hypothetical protein